MIPVSGRSPGKENGYPLQYSCLENPMDRGDWRATVHGVAKSRTRLSTMHKDMTGLNICPATLLSATLYFLITRAVHGEGNGSPLQHSCLKNPMDGGTWWAAVHGVAKTQQLHLHFSLSCIGEGNGNPLQCSCLENPRDWGASWAAIHGVAQSRT